MRFVRQFTGRGSLDFRRIPQGHQICHMRAISLFSAYVSSELIYFLYQKNTKVRHSKALGPNELLYSIQYYGLFQPAKRHPSLETCYRPAKTAAFTPYLF
jgi:hypothetical protein